MIKIYKLIYKEDVIYIGKTILSLGRRKGSGYPNIPFYKECLIELIEETKDVSRERYWIEYYQNMGYKLMNKRNGDHSNYTIKEYRNKRKIIQVNNYIKKGKKGKTPNLESFLIKL